MRRPHTRRARRHDERGAVMPMIALLVVVLLGFTAFAVDLGLQRVAARDMQSLADAVALDTARALPSCDATALTAKANTSLARQQRRIGRESPLVVTPGHLDTSTRAFVPGTGTAGCDAVRITTATTVDFAFAPVIGTDSGTATRQAVGARAEPAICFSAGTKALVLNSSASALGPVLDQILRVNMSVVGYEGIVALKDTTIPLAGLSTELGVGTAQELVNLSHLSLRDFMLAQARVLRKQGDAVNANLLQTLAARVGTATLDVGRILAVGNTGNGALDADVNALDVLGAAIVAANGTNAVRVDGLGLSLGPLAAASSTATIIEPPQIACGRTGAVARTAQVKINLDTSLLGLGTAFSGAQVSLGVNVAQGTATLGAMRCGTSATAAVSAVTGVASVGGSGTRPHATVTGLRIGPLAVVDVRLGGAVGATTHAPFTFAYPTTGLPPVHTFGSNASLTLTIERIDLLGILPIGGVLNALVTPLVNTVSGAVNTLLTPVLGALGVKLGAMDVSLLGRPSCQAVKIAG